MRVLIVEDEIQLAQALARGRDLVKSRRCSNGSTVTSNEPGRASAFRSLMRSRAVTAGPWRSDRDPKEGWRRG